MHLRPILLMAILFLAGQACGQRVEELITRMSALPEGSEQLALLAQVTKLSVQQRSYEEAAEFAGMGSEKSRELDLMDQAVEFEMILASCADASGDVDRCLTHGLRAFYYCPEEADDLRARCALLLARTYAREGMHSKAHDFAQAVLSLSGIDPADECAALLLRTRALLATQDLDRAAESMDVLLASARRWKNEPLIFQALGMRATLHAHRGDHASAMTDEHARLALAKGVDRGIVLNNLGELYARLDEHEKAHHYFGEAATWLALEPDLYGRCLLNSAISYARQRKLAMAWQVVENTIGVIGGQGSGTGLVEALLVRSGVELLDGMLAEAMATARMAMEEAQRTGKRPKELEALELLARISLEKGALIEKQQYDMKAFALRQELAVQDEMAQRLRNQRENALHRQERDIGSLTGSEQRERLRAREAVLAAEYQAKEFGLLVAEKELQDSRYREETLARERAQQELDLLQGALARERQERELRQLQDDRTVQMLQLNKLDLEKKQKEQSMAMLKRQNELLEKDSALQAAAQERSRFIANGAFVAVALCAAVALFFFWVTRKVKGKNRTIKQQVAQIGEMNGELSRKNADLMSSITYARGIQRTIVPTQQDLDGLLPGGFLFYRPRDVVSGDLPFLLDTPDRVFVAAIDCTGHGVPAAMLSFIAYFNLTEILQNSPRMPLNKVMEELHRRVIARVGRSDDGDGLADGMDVALCGLDKRDGTLHFCGAGIGMLAHAGGSVTRIKGDRRGVGDRSEETPPTYTNHEFPAGSLSRCYLFSDGIIHQFGGADGRRKLSHKLLMERCLEWHDMTGESAAARVTELFDGWKGEQEQTDDALLIGFEPACLVKNKAA